MPLVRSESVETPTVVELLDVDREYRLSPLPVLHTQRGTRRYSALYSESPVARRIGRVGDWVILDLEIEGPDLQWTVVTEFRGRLKGKRVVRGREGECFDFYLSERRAQQSMPLSRCAICGAPSG